MNQLQNPTLAPYAKEGEVELRITARADNEEQAAALIAPVEQEVRELLGDLVYGADVTSLEQVVLAALKEKGLTLGAAESCTGGLIAKRFTDLSGASAVFQGGVVSYTNQVKAGVLGVPQALLDERGAVCAEVARAMAEGARRVLGCDLALSATGVAGPDSDDRGNPVGLVYVGLCAPEGCWVRQLNLAGPRDRRDRVAHHGCQPRVRHDPAVSGRTAGGNTLRRTKSIFDSLLSGTRLHSRRITAHFVALGRRKVSRTLFLPDSENCTRTLMGISSHGTR